MVLSKQPDNLHLNETETKRKGNAREVKSKVKEAVKLFVLYRIEMDSFSYPPSQPSPIHSVTANRHFSPPHLATAPTLFLSSSLPHVDCR